MIATHSERIRSAVIGCGRMGAVTSEAMRRFAPPAWMPLSHAEAVLAQPCLELVGVCDIAPEPLAAAAARFSVPAYADYRQLLDALRPKLVTVATRTPERPDVIAASLAAGARALHLEKPLCNSVAQLTQLEALFADPSLACTFGTLRRYMPIYHRARTLASEAYFGGLSQVQVNMGKAPLMWTHPHSIDLLLFLAGDRPVKSVSARFADGSVERHGSRIDGDPVVTSILFEFDDGLSGVIGQTGGCDVVLAGNNGTIAVESDGRRLRIRTSEGSDIYWDRHLLEEADGSPGGTRLALDRLVEGLNGNAAQILADKRAILTGQRLLLACGQSHLAGGAAVDPAQLDPKLVITGRSGNRYA
ncbi:Gfo/Idh/MocA family oxidoreductase [uncultured Propionivibrio sp.]|uniref:Gfo/Idh/MocA family protein n=1 Tax=uncultured Propionivibrio sp. TaxID=426737 RepID=UPI0029BFE1A5|nr:Gfo/Idh/MocA family oxidoreductase [uncultured Propionivibrio sp.]